MAERKDPHYLIIDTDAGVDDAVAIMMALAHPKNEVIAITTVNGNVDVEKVTRNVALTLDAFKSDVPIYKGCRQPLLNAWMHSDGIHGVDGLGGVSDLKSTSKRRTEHEHAVLALMRLARQHSRQFTLLTLGPLTNIALAVRMDPTFIESVSRLVMMGGAVEARGNASPVSEFNIFADPEAASIVLDAGFEDLWMISWETTLKHPLPWIYYEEITSFDTPRAEFFGEISALTAGLLKDRYQFPGFLLPDPLAAAVALEPGIVAEAVHLPVSVEISGQLGRGLTGVDWFQQFGQPPSAHVVQRIDRERLWELLKRTFL